MELALIEYQDMASGPELTRQVTALEERVKNHITFFWTVVAFGFVWLAAVSVQLFLINGKLGPLVGAAATPAAQLYVAAENPTVAQNQDKVLRVLSDTREAHTPIPTDTLASAGHSFVAASEQDSGAWKTTQALMAYRTYVTSLTFTVPITGTVPQNTSYLALSVPGEILPSLGFVPQGVSEGNAARLQRIGKPTNPNVTMGPEELIAMGGATRIDGMDIAHVIFDGVEVHYDGGPLRLQDVIFVNCTFVFFNANRSRSLADSIITSKTVDFSDAG
jgi:hypothetical protein